MSRVRSVTATRVIDAPAATVFDLLADPAQHARLDGSGTVMGLREGPERLHLGAIFEIEMKIKQKYRTRNRVVVFEENRAIAWHHVARFVWRYDLEEVASGTRVTEIFTYDKPWGFLIALIGWPERNRRGMEATLARLEGLVTS
jgi:uncharacterized protein YndB with AHSA1/START domain